jgi:hypothetical protein
MPLRCATDHSSQQPAIPVHPDGLTGEARFVSIDGVVRLTRQFDRVHTAVGKDSY